MDGACDAARVEERLIKFAGADADLAGVVVARLEGKGPQSKLDEAEGGGVPFDLSCAAPACVREDVRNPREPDVGWGFDPPRSRPEDGPAFALKGVAGVADDAGNTVSPFDKDPRMGGSSTGARGGEKCLGRGSRSPVMGPCENAS